MSATVKMDLFGRKSLSKVKYVVRFKKKKFQRDKLMLLVTFKVGM